MTERNFSLSAGLVFVVGLTNYACGLLRFHAMLESVWWRWLGVGVTDLALLVLVLAYMRSDRK